MSGRFGRSARFIAAAGGALVLGVIALVVAARTGAIDAWLTSTIAARLDQGLRFSSANAVYWPRLGVVLNDVAVDPIPGVPTQGTASATTVACRIRLRALLAGRVEIGSVHVDGLRLAAVRGADGVLHAGGLETLVGQESAGSSPGTDLFPSVPSIHVANAALEYQRDGADAPPPLRLQSVDAELTPSGNGGDVAITARVDGGGSLSAHVVLDSLGDPASGRFRGTINADGLDAATVLAWLPARGASGHGQVRATATVSGQGTAQIAGDVSLEFFDGALSWSDVQADAPIHLKAHAAWDGHTWALSEARLDAARVARGALSAETVEVSCGYADGVLQVDTAALRACGGTWRPAGRFRLSDPPQLDGSIEAEGVDPARLVEVLKTFGVSQELPALDAPLRLTATASGTPGGSWTTKVTIATDGGATWAGTRVDGPVSASADATLTGTVLALSNGHAQAHRVASGSLVLDDVDAGFAYSDRGLSLSPLHCKAFGGTWSYSGTVPMGPSTAWRGQVSGSAVSVAALRRAFPAAGAGPADGALDLRADLSGTGTRAVSGPVNARLSAPTLTWDNLQIGAPAEMTGTLRVQNSRLAIASARVTATMLRTGEVSAADLSSAFSYADSTLRLSALTARGFRGRWQAEGTVTFGATPTFTGNVQAHRIDFENLLDVADPGQRDGPHSINGVADLSMQIARERDGDVVGSARVDLKSGSFVWDDLLVQGPAHAKGSFGIRNGAFSLPQATAQAAHAAYGPFKTTNASAEFAYVAPRLTFKTLRFESCGGKWSHNGWFTLVDDGQFAGQLAVESAVPRQVAEMLLNDGADISFAQLDLESEFTGVAVDDFQEHLRATGNVYLTDGTMRAANVLRPIWEAIVGPGRVTTMMGRASTHIQELSGTFALRQGGIDTTDLSLVTDDFQVTAVGSVELDGRLDLEARIQVTSNGVQKMLVFGSVPLPTGGLPNLPPIPADVSGTLADPIIRPRMYSLPATTVRWLVEALLQTPRSLGESVWHHLGKAWDAAKRVVGRGD